MYKYYYYRDENSHGNGCGAEKCVHNGVTKILLLLTIEMTVINRSLNSRTPPNAAVTEEASRAVQSCAARFERCARTVSRRPRRGDV